MGFLEILVKINFTAILFSNTKKTKNCLPFTFYQPCIFNQDFYTNLCYFYWRVNVRFELM